jgi:single-strand DNA-binding protein
MSVNTTAITVVGKVITDLTPRVTPGGHKVVNFRIATQERVYDKDQDLWADGDRMYLTVTCWRHLADHAADSLNKGDQVVVHGRMKIRDYTTEAGAHRTNLEVEARAIGPDLALHTVTVNRPDWAISPHQQTLLNPPPEQQVPLEVVTQEEVVQAA